MSEAPHVHKKVDEDWKNQVEREKSASATAPRSPQPSPSPSQGTDATPQSPAQSQAESELFEVFLSSLAMQAYAALGEEPDPATGMREVRLDQAQYMIDILGVIQHKMRGNLTEVESRALSTLLYDLRVKFMEKKKA